MSALLVRDFAFQHDRVQQAAYELLDEEARQQTHLVIGRRLLATLPAQDAQERVFEVVGHFNLGRALVADAAERNILAERNLAAARKATSSAAYEAALSYVIVAQELLGEASWHDNYAVTFNSFQQRAMLEYLNGNFKRCAEVVDETLRSARTSLDRAQVYFPRIMQQTMLSQFSRAIEAGRDALALLGIELDLDDPLQAGQREIAKVRQSLQGRVPASLYGLADLKREDMALAQRCLTHLTIATFLGDQRVWPLVVGTSVRLSLEHGNAPESALAFANFGLILGASFDRYHEGFEFGQLALRLCERFGGRAATATVSLVVGAELIPWVQNARKGVPVVDHGYESAVESGDILWAGYLVMYRVLLDAYTGRRLDQMLDDISEQIAFTTKSGNVGATAGIRAHQIVLSTLAGRTGSNNDFSADSVDEATFVDDCKRQKLAMAFCLYKILKAQAEFLFGRPKQALQATRDVDEMLSFIVNHPNLADHLLYQSLAIGALCRAGMGGDTTAALEKMRANLERLSVWAENCPENYLAKRLMVEAEIARVSGDEGSVTHLYDQAADTAHQAQFLHDEGLANELAARFELERWPTSRVGAMFLRDACYAYRLWGANRKVQALELEFPDLLASYHDSKRVRGAPSTLSPDSFQWSVATSTTAELDLKTLLRAAEAISGEVVLERLLDKLQAIVIENAGARRGLILLPHDGEFVVAAERSVDPECGAGLQPVVSQASDGLTLYPASIINYATRTRRPVVADDAQQDEQFLGDPYIQRQETRSILCQPIVHQGELIGIVYLENDLAAGAFTQERTQISSFVVRTDRRLA